MNNLKHLKAIINDLNNRDINIITSIEYINTFTDYTLYSVTYKETTVTSNLSYKINVKVYNVLKLKYSNI